MSRDPVVPPLPDGLGLLKLDYGLAASLEDPPRNSYLQGPCAEAGGICVLPKGLFMPAVEESLGAEIDAA